MLTITRAAGASPDRSGAVYTPTELESEVIALFAPFRSGKKGIWLTAEPRQYLAGLPADYIGDFAARDRAFNRLLLPANARHPFVVTDVASGKPTWCFGAGGSNNNDLSSALNGALDSPSILKKGAEDNRLPLFAPDTGWSVAARVLVPVPSSTVNGIAFGATTGGAIVGGGGATTATSMAMSIETSVGRLRGFNNFGVVTAGQYYDNAVDRRNGAWQTLQMVYDDAAGAFSAYSDAALISTLAGITNDIAVNADNAMPIIGGVGNGGNNPRFVGLIKGLIVLPTAILNQSGPRSIVSDYLATL